MSIEEINFEYVDESTNCKGVLFLPESSSRCPAVLVAHTWKGISDFEINKAKELAKLGYAGLAIDIFGNGVNGKNIEENQALIKPFVDNRKKFRTRVASAISAIKSHPSIDGSKIGLIGYCFGGMAVLEIARSGLDVSGVVSFHGLLNRSVEPINKIHSKILVLHGDKDPMVPRDIVQDFYDEMDESDANWEFISYGNAMHAFTNPEANDPSFGTQFNETANQRSWNSMKLFFEEVF